MMSRGLSTALMMALVATLGTAACSARSDSAASLQPVSRPVSSSASSSPSPEATADDCPPSGRRISSGGSDAALGLRIVGLRLTNCGTEPQRVKGYPVVELFDADHQRLPITVEPGAVAMADPDPGTKSLLLKPGESAFSTLSWRNTVLADGSETLTGEYARLAAGPGEPAHQEVLHVDPGTTGRVAVTAWFLPKKTG
jgi:hypothetical protein